MRSIRAAGWLALALTVGCGGASPLAEVEAPEAGGLAAAPEPEALGSAEPSPAPPKPSEAVAEPVAPKPVEAVAPAVAPPKPAEALAVAPAPAPPDPPEVVAVAPAPAAPVTQPPAPVEAVVSADADTSDDDQASEDEAVAANAEGSSGGAGSDDDEEASEDEASEDEASEDEAVAAEDEAAEDEDDEPPPVARDDESLVLLESDGVMRVKQRWARLRESAYERLHAIAERYHEATGRRLVVTGGGRKPARQAELMYGMMKDGKDLLRLYIQVTLVRPLISAFEKGQDQRWGRRRTVAVMTKIIDDQVQEGRYVSRHLAHTAADVRSRGLSDEDVEALKAAVTEVKGSHLVDERNGNAPHFHLRL